MRRFEYRFENLLRLQEQARDDAQRSVAEAQKALDILDEQLSGVDARRTELRTKNQKRLTGTISVDSLLDVGRFDLQLEANKKQLLEQRVQVVHEMEKRRRRLIACEKECRKFEKLREIAWEQYQQESLKRQQTELDEIASQRARPSWGELS